jgi:hypothetical protein
MGFGHGEKPLRREDRASSMRSVHIEGSTHAHRARMSPPCLAVPGTDDGCSSLDAPFTHPPPCLPSLHARYGVSSLLRRL